MKKRNLIGICFTLAGVSFSFFFPSLSWRQNGTRHTQTQLCTHTLKANFYFCIESTKPRTLKASAHLPKSRSTLDFGNNSSEKKLRIVVKQTAATGIGPPSIMIPPSQFCVASHQHTVSRLCKLHFRLCVDSMQ